MRKGLLAIAALSLFLAGCAGKQKLTAVQSCSYAGDPGYRAEYRISYTDDTVTAITVRLTADASSAGKSRDELLQELQSGAKLGDMHVAGLSYQYDSEGTAVTRTEQVDLTKLAYAYFRKLELCPDDLLEGNEKGYTLSLKSFEAYLEDSFGAQCSLSEAK